MDIGGDSKKNKFQSPGKLKDLEEEKNPKEYSDNYSGFHTIKSDNLYDLKPNKDADDSLLYHGRYNLRRELGRG